jgi:hypothetical protein
VKDKILLLLFLIALFVPLATVFSDEVKPEIFSATAVNTTGPSPKVSMKIYINSYTSDEEVTQLANILKTQGPDALLKAINKVERGRIAPVRKTGTDVGFVRQRMTDSGRHITMVMERPMSFAELYRGSRSTDYPFGILQMDVDKNGKGTGTFMVAAKIKFTADNTVEVENYSVAPMRLMGLSKMK